MRRKSIILLMLYFLATCGCESYLDHRSAGRDYTQRSFLQDNQTNVPVNAQLQVYLGDKVSEDDFAGLIATLEDAEGRPVPGRVELKPESMILVFIPDSRLAPETAYVLTIFSPSGDVFVYHFTTAPASGEDPPVVVILSPAAGETVSGVIRVQAEVTDNTGFGEVFAMLDGQQTGWRGAAPYDFFVNTTRVANGLRLLEVWTMDLEGNIGTGRVEVIVQNGPASSTPFWILAEGLAPGEGITASVEFHDALVPGMVAVLLALTEDNYTDWAREELKVGEYQAAAGYAGNDLFASPGVACLRIVNFSGAARDLPGATLTLVMPDHSTLTVYLPALTIGMARQAAFYIAADGSTHYAHAAGGSVPTGLVPDFSPAQALANPQAAP